MLMCTHDTQTEKTIMDNIESVGIREFRANLHKYTTAGNTPIAVTSHGRPVGYYIPAHPSPQKEDFEALKIAVNKLSALLEKSGTTEDEVVEEFDRLRQQDKQNKPT